MLGKAGHGWARQSRARLGLARQGMARHCKGRFAVMVAGGFDSRRRNCAAWHG